MSVERLAEHARRSVTSSPDGISCLRRKTLRALGGFLPSLCSSRASDSACAVCSVPASPSCSLILSCSYPLLHHTEIMCPHPTPPPDAHRLACVCGWLDLVRPRQASCLAPVFRSNTHAPPTAATRLPWALATARPHFATVAPPGLCWEPLSPSGSKGPRPERCSNVFDNLGQGPLWTDPRGAVGATRGLAESSDLRQLGGQAGRGALPVASMSLGFHSIRLSLPPCVLISCPKLYFRLPSGLTVLLPKANSCA